MLMSHVFVSYSTRNSEYAHKLAEKLREEGFDVWIDNTRLRSSEDWWRSIVLAIRVCAAVVVVLTPESDASEWVQREITLAGKYKKPIFPLWLDGSLDTPNWEYFVRIQIEDVRGGKLPPPHLYDTLSLHTPRQERRGANVTEQPPALPEVMDREFEQEIANPPKATPTLARLPQVRSRPHLGKRIGTSIAKLKTDLITMRNRSNASRLVVVAVVLLAPIVIVLVVVSQPDLMLGTIMPLPTSGASVIALAQTDITTNNQWTPVSQMFDGIEMVLVPTGCFDIGTDSTQSANQVCFESPFWIDRTEVTNEQYGSTGTFSGDKLPRDSVNWSDAKDFCESRNGRLATEAEWEYAARGPDRLTYPWGNTRALGNFVNSENSNNQTAPVGSKPSGVSWVGTLDMIGNVWEWVSTIYDQNLFPYPYTTDDGREDINRTNAERVMRGGSWSEREGYWIESSSRIGSNPTNIYSNVGFRCARDYP
jgi:formylglycine-generating enzyme required for sulfatase activity